MHSGWHRLFWLENIHIRRFAINRNWSFNGLSCEVCAREGERARERHRERERIYMKRKKNRSMSISNFISLVLWSVLCRRVDDHYQHRRARERERKREREREISHVHQSSPFYCMYVCSSRLGRVIHIVQHLCWWEWKKRNGVNCKWRRREKPREREEIVLSLN